MALFDWLFGRTPKSTQQNQPERAREEFRPAPIARAPARPAFAHALRVPEGSFRFVALDVETACSDASSICQIGLACVQPDNQIQTFSMLVNPGTRFDAFNIQLHGIGPDHVADAPHFPDALTALLPLLKRHHLIQHSNFDKQAINAACGFCGIDAPDLRWSDSVQIARRAWPELKGNGGHGLANLKRTLNLQFHHHDAGEDARAAAMVVLHAELHLRLPFEELIKPAIKKNYSAPITMDGDPNGALAGSVVVFTGALGMSRNEAAELAARVGMSVKPGVTKETTHLVVGDQDLTVLAGHTKSSKHRKAEDMQSAGHPIRIIGESAFKSLVAKSKASCPPHGMVPPRPRTYAGGRSAAFRLRQALSPGKPVGIHLPGGLGESEKLSNTCGITIWARWILLWNPLERVFGSHFVEATTPEATHTIGQSTPRKCRARRARQQDRAGQARPVYLSSSPSSRAIRSPLKSPACGVGSCIERTKN